MIDGTLVCFPPPPLFVSVAPKGVRRIGERAFCAVLRQNGILQSWIYGGLLSGGVPGDVVLLEKGDSGGDGDGSTGDRGNLER